jgi:hypothetical protein
MGRRNEGWKHLSLSFFGSLRSSEEKWGEDPGKPHPSVSRALSRESRMASRALPSMAPMWPG